VQAMTLAIRLALAIVGAAVVVFLLWVIAVGV
jgi:hypothetical protein